VSWVAWEANHVRRSLTCVPEVARVSVHIALVSAARKLLIQFDTLARNALFCGRLQRALCAGNERIWSKTVIGRSSCSGDFRGAATPAARLYLWWVVARPGGAGVRRPGGSPTGREIDFGAQRHGRDARGTPSFGVRPGHPATAAAGTGHRRGRYIGDRIGGRHSRPYFTSFGVQPGRPAKTTGPTQCQPADAACASDPDAESDRVTLGVDCDPVALSRPGHSNAGLANVGAICRGCGWRERSGGAADRLQGRCSVVAGFRLVVFVGRSPRAQA